MAILSQTSCVHELQPQYEVPSWIEGDDVVGSLEGTEVIGFISSFLLGDSDGWSVGEDVGKTTECIGERVGLFVGTTDGPPMTHDPLWHTPKGTELHGVESDKY